MEARQHLEGIPVSVASARHWAASCAEEWGLHHIVDILQLLVSEMVANAVMHAGTDCVLVLRLTEPMLSVEVCDGSPEAPSLAPDDREVGGRGLKILAAFSSSWGFEPTSHGKRVWAQIDTTNG